MSLVEAIRAFVEANEWEDEVEFDVESGQSRLTTGLEVANQEFELNVIGEEKAERLTLYLITPFRALNGKQAECCRLFNFLNDEYLYSGRISLDREGRIMYRAVLDTDDMEAEPAMIHNMLRGGNWFFKRHIEAIAAVAVTGKGFDAVLEEYEKKEALKEARKAAGKA